MPAECLLCRPAHADALMNRRPVWADALWRLSTEVSGGYTPGFSYLEPKRHIPYVTDLDGDEAATFGPVLARCTAALKAATACEQVYVYVFGGGVEHLHVHLAPHVAGDALNDALLRGSFEERRLPAGLTEFVSIDFAPLPDADLAAVAARVRDLLDGPARPNG